MMDTRSRSIERIAARRTREETGGSDAESGSREETRGSDRERLDRERLAEAAQIHAAAERVSEERRREAEHRDAELGTRSRSLMDSIYDGLVADAALGLKEIVSEAGGSTDAAEIRKAVVRDLRLEEGLGELAPQYPTVMQSRHLAKRADQFLEDGLAIGMPADQALRHALDSAEAEGRQLVRDAGYRDKGATRDTESRAERGGEAQSASAVVAEMAAQRAHVAAQRSRGDE